MKASTGIIGIGALLAITLLAGCATTSVNSKSVDAQSAVRASNQHCGPEAASRVPANGSNCQGAGRSYSGEDIDRTGKTSAADALALLNPSISVGR